MAQQFDTRIMTLGQLFANPILIRTPAFQRTFSWTWEEASTLVDEIESGFEEAGSDQAGCFLGTMLFIEPERAGSRLPAWPLGRNQRVLEVVDGLQRLTTLTMLFSLLRDIDRSDAQRPNDRILSAIATAQGRNGRFRFMLREPDEAFFQNYVRQPGATLLNPDSEALSAAEERIIGVREYLRETVGAYDLLQRQRLAAFLLDQCFVAVLSTTGVDRAHRMFTVLNTAGKPLGRNDILKAQLLAGLKAQDMQRAIAGWDAAEKHAGGDFESLFSHIRTIHGRSSPNVISSVKDIAARAGGGLPFVERILQPAAEICEAIAHARHEGSPHSGSIAASLTHLNWLKGNADWVPAALLWWLEKGKDPAELTWFLAALDRLAYGLRIQGRGNKRRLTRMNAVLHAIRSGQDLKKTGSPLNLAREELRMVHHSLRDLHKRHAQVAKLVLLRLNDVLAGKPQRLDAEEFTVEHLLPRKPGINSPWRAHFPDPADRDRFTESLGNLVLVSKLQNDKAGNLDFARKREVLFGTGPHLPINEYVRRQTEWKAVQIEAREAELLKLLDGIWQIGPPPGRRGDPPTGTPRRKATADA
jgi:hypothetical protein